MKRFLVTMPIAGSACAVVEAESEAEAEAAFFKRWEECEGDVEITWDFYPKLVEGNICHAPDTRTEIEEFDE